MNFDSICPNILIKIMVNILIRSRQTFLNNIKIRIEMIY